MKYSMQKKKIVRKSLISWFDFVYIFFEEELKNALQWHPIKEQTFSRHQTVNSLIKPLFLSVGLRSKEKSNEALFWIRHLDADFHKV